MKWVKHIFFKVGLSEHLWQTLTQADNQCGKFAWGLLQNNALKGIIGQIRRCFFSVFTCFVFCSDKGTRACISAEENAAYKESHYHFMRGVAITSRHILLDVSRQLCRQKTVHFPAFFSEVLAPFFVLENLRFWLTNQICPTISHFPDKWSKIEIHEMGARDCVHDYLPVTFPLFSNKSCSLSPPKFVAGKGHDFPCPTNHPPIFPPFLSTHFLSRSRNANVCRRRDTGTRAQFWFNYSFRDSLVMQHSALTR